MVQSIFYPVPSKSAQAFFFFAFHLIRQNAWCNGTATCPTKPRGSQRRVSYLDARNYSTLAKPGRCNNSRKCVFFQGGRRTALEIAVTFACKVVFSGMFFVSCLLVRECRGRDGHFLKKMISMLFIFLLGEIPGWILMAKE